jgi:hypothetical protein
MEPIALAHEGTTFSDLRMREFDVVGGGTFATVLAVVATGGEFRNRMRIY